MKPGMRLLIAILLGLFAGIIALSSLSQKEKEVAQRGEPVEVMFAKTRIDPGKLIIPDMVEKRRIPGSFKQPDAVTTPDKVIDQTAVVVILPNEQILASKLSPSLMRPLTEVIPRGMRTVTITTDITHGAAGLVQVSDKIDILGVFHLEKPGGGLITSARMVFQNIDVIAVGQYTVPNVLGQTRRQFAAIGEAGPESVGFTLTLAMTPFDAQRMVLLQELARIYVMPRFKGEGPEPLQFPVITSEDVSGSEFPVWTPAKKEYNMFERLGKTPAPGR